MRVTSSPGPGRAFATDCQKEYSSRLEPVRVRDDLRGKDPTAQDGCWCAMSDDVKAMLRFVQMRSPEKLAAFHGSINSQFKLDRALVNRQTVQQA
jgi:hypothetical protein